MKNDLEQLVDNLILVLNGEITIEAFKENLNPNYTDLNGNGCFHFLADYSFEQFFIKNIKSDTNKRKEIINEKKYNKMKNEYALLMNSFTNLLISINCDILTKNKYNQNPLIYSITKNNYIASKEYFLIQKDLGLYDQGQYQNILNAIINNGDATNKDCLVLIDLVLSSTDENKNMIFNSSILNKEIKECELTPIVWLCKNFSAHIYEKYNTILKMKSIDYLIDKNNNSIIDKQLDQNTLNEIKKKAYEELNNFINDNFYLLLLKLISLGSNINYYEDKNKSKKTSAFMYLMKYPFFQNISLFVQDTKININYEDYLDNTALNYLINNRKSIKTISKDVYDNTFKYLLDNIKMPQITKFNKNGESAFFQCLMNQYFDEAKMIFYKFKNEATSNLYSDILIYIIHAIKNENNIGKIDELLKIFRNDIDFKLFNRESQRTLFHYICIYLSDKDVNLNLFRVINLCINLKIDLTSKDQFNRNALFYLFISENDIVKNGDPHKILEYLFQYYKNNDLNVEDIFGNNLLVYAYQSKAANCIKLLINHGVNLNFVPYENENSIYATALLNGDLESFVNLYNMNKDPQIFGYKIYKPYEINQKKIKESAIDNNEIGETLYDFLNKNNYSSEPNLLQKQNNIKDNINNFNNIFNNANNNNNNNILNFSISEKNINNKYEFNILNCQNEQMLKLLENNTKSISIKIEEKEGNDKNNIINNNIINNNIINNNIDNEINKSDIISNFKNNYDGYITERISEEKEVLSNDLFSYCLSKNYNDLCKFMIKEKYNLISICCDLISFHKFNDINECVKQVLSENNNDQNKLLQLRNEKGQTLYHILPDIQNNLFFCKNLENHNISNIFDTEGNTPMYYACKNFNIIFIETFSHYSFVLSDNSKDKVNYSLFLETKNGKTPLEILYDKLNKRDEKVLQLLIDISINMKKVYFIPVIKFLIQNYNPVNNKIMLRNYTKNINSIEYFRKVVGLYQFYIKELNGSVMIKDEFGNDPFFICAENTNFDFLFNILLEEHNIALNSTNNEGKSIVHLIVNLPGYLNNYKENILKQAIESGFDFNIKDKEDMLPIDYAYLQEDLNIINILSNYYINFGLEVPKNRNIKPKNKINYDFNKDSDNLFNESISVSVKIDKFEDLTSLVNINFKSNNSSLYQVCTDEISSIPYSVNLIKKNFVSPNESKVCIQIIKDVLNDNNNKYLLLIISGSLSSQRKILEYKSLEDAVEQFKKIFKEYTGNEWDDVKNNKKNLKNDYLNNYIFDYSYEDEDAIYDYLKITIKNLYIKKKLEFSGDNKIKTLIYYLLVKAYQNKFSIEENNRDVEMRNRDIIKKYKSTAISKAVNILFEIKNLLNEGVKDEIYIKKRNYLISSYNELIPYSNKSNDINLFTDVNKINQEISRLTTYYYIENVLKIFLGAIYNLDQIHPLDYVINSLGCKIEEIPKPQNTEDPQTEADYIYNFLYSTGAYNGQIQTVYKIIQSKHDKIFNLKNHQNRFIFCHGTKVENILGILSQGLKISPVQAKYTGSAYGHGIYLSDCFNVSLAYCKSRNNLFGNLINNNNKVFMLLAEVAVGKIGLNEDTNIVNMSLDFNDAYITNEGYGIFKNSSNINYGNGIIVAHDETNVRVKYIVEIG